MPSANVLQAIAVTAELTGTVLSEAAARMFAQDLEGYDESVLMDALTRSRRELKGRLTVADVLSRIPTGHPTPEEAWSMVHQALGDEGATLVLTGPMRTAFWAADALADDKIAARMAFLEVYRREVSGAPPLDWGVIAGWDMQRRQDVIERAVTSGRLTRAAAQQFLPPPRDDEHERKLVKQFLQLA